MLESTGTSRVKFLKTSVKHRLVFRLSGNMNMIEEIKNCVDAGDLDYLAQVQDVHNLTGTFKLFFRELKDPLLPWGNRFKSHHV